MRLACPFCGERGLAEFLYRGAASPERPSADAPDQAWVDYVHLRDNPAGPHAEFWQHLGGCRAWLVVERDTRTHAVLAVRSAR